MTTRRLTRVQFAAALLLLPFLLITPPGLAAQDMVWSFNEGNDAGNSGRMTAYLAYGVPETDIAQVSGVCEARSSTSVDSSSLILGTDVGALKDGEAVNLRFTGGGFDHSVPATVTGANAEVGITGVQLELPHDDPLWKALGEKVSLDYLVPGYSASRLDLANGRREIASFVAACRSYAEALAPKQTAGAGTPAAPQAGGSGSSVTEREAFEAAKELGTIEAWEAFLNSFPTGFRADLARAYVKRIGREDGGSVKPAQSAAKPAGQPGPAPEPKLSLLNLGPGSTPWGNANKVLATAGNQKVYTASVKGGGLEFVTYCRDWSRSGGTGHGLHAVLRESPRGQYPDFDARIRQALANAAPYQGGRGIQLSFSTGKTFDGITLGEQVLDGEVLIGDGGQAISQGLAFQEILAANTMTVLAPPFAATFQLTNSRAAICNVFKRCGATNRPECSKFAPRSVSTQPAAPKKQKAATPKKKKATKKKSRCGSGSVWLEGQCVPRSLVVEFCGPGYKRSGSKCVSRY